MHHVLPGGAVLLLLPSRPRSQGPWLAPHRCGAHPHRRDDALLPPILIRSRTDQLHWHLL